MQLFGRQSKNVNKQVVAPSAIKSFSEIFRAVSTSSRKNKLNPGEAVNYYSISSPVATAISWITTSAAAIDVCLYDKARDKYVYDNDLLTLINNPNPAYGYDYFIQSLLSYYLLTGNAYVIATGFLDKSPPVSLYIVPSQNVTPEINFTDGYVDKYVITNTAGQVTFGRQLKNKQFIYMDSTGTKQLYHIKNLALDSSNFGIKGDSPLNSIYYEIEQSISGNVHNLSLLNRGANLSGVFSTDESLTQEAYDRLSNMINLYFTGSNNAGRPLLAENGLTFESMMQSNKDMDFSTLKSTVEQSIFKAFKLPLPLLMAETMTMANMDAARLDLYRNAVLPVVDRIFADLTRFLTPFYPANSGLILYYDESKIGALKPEVYSNAEILNNTGVFTANDIRKSLGVNALIGGNDLYQSAANVPYATSSD